MNIEPNQLLLHSSVEFNHKKKKINKKDNRHWEWDEFQKRNLRYSDDDYAQNKKNSEDEHEHVHDDHFDFFPKLNAETVKIILEK